MEGKCSKVSLKRYKKIIFFPLQLIDGRLESDQPVESSQSIALLSLPLERMYLEFLENLTEETDSLSCASLNVLIHRLLTPSQT